jgi:hypothetical protein
MNTSHDDPVAINENSLSGTSVSACEKRGIKRTRAKDP